MKRNIAFIVQRYGIEVNGGAELHCRNLSERLAIENNVEILTTCALDYKSWENYYDEGETQVNGLKVRRFITKSTRNPKKEKQLRKFLQPRFIQLKKFHLFHFFASLHQKFRFSDDWLKAQGPYCPDLIHYLKEMHQQYDVLIFMTYLYYPTALGLRIAPEKSILIPTAHDEKAIYYSCFKHVFQLPAYIMFNMKSEQQFVHNLFKNQKIPNDIAGVGIDIPTVQPSDLFSRTNNIENDFLLYVGRVDGHKGVNELIHLFVKYKKKSNNGLKLVIIGKSSIVIPPHPDIIYLGFVTDDIKNQAMKEALLLVLPSKFESLSMVVLESMSFRTPVLVNGACDVLVEHCKKSHAGFYYNTDNEFLSAIHFALEHKNELDEMGKLGEKYVIENYKWDVIINKFNQAFQILENKKINKDLSI